MGRADVCAYLMAKKTQQTDYMKQVEFLASTAITSVCPPVSSDHYVLNRIDLLEAVVIGAPIIGAPRKQTTDTRILSPFFTISNVPGNTGHPRCKLLRGDQGQRQKRVFASGMRDPNDCHATEDEITGIQVGRSRAYNVPRNRS